MAYLIGDTWFVAICFGVSGIYLAYSLVLAHEIYKKKEGITISFSEFWFILMQNCMTPSNVKSLTEKDAASIKSLKLATALHFFIYLVFVVSTILAAGV